MHAIPETFAGGRIDTTGKYGCPLCQIQHTGDKVDTKWVYCPMSDNKPICLGCCIDYQKVARSNAFGEHPERHLFDRLASQTRTNIYVLRKQCLAHQRVILLGELANPPEAFDDPKLTTRIRQERLQLLSQLEFVGNDE